MAVFILAPMGWGILVGLALGYFGFHLSGIAVALVMGISLCGSSLAWRLKLPRGLVLCGLACGTSLGLMLWHNSLLQNEYEPLYDQRLDVEASVVDRPTVTQSGNQAIVLLPDGFTQYVRVSLFHHAYVRIGDRVWLRGELKQPENFEGFNYVNYLKQKNIYAELGKAKVIPVGHSGGAVAAGLEALRQNVVRQADLTLTEPAAAIVLGMLIGERDKLPGPVEESFQKAGLIHVLVVSGFNLTLIASGIGIAARVVGRKPADYLSLILIWLFVILVGASSAVVRAGIMASIIITARLFGRQAWSSVSLLLAVAVMSAVNPWQLFYDIGFQLSIAATWGVLQTNVLRVWFGREGWLSELVWPSLGAIFATAPIVAHYFGTLSIVAPLANLLILPMIPYTMLAGALTLLPIIQAIFAPVAEMIVSIQLRLVSVLAGWRFSQVEITMHPSIIVSYYALLFFSLFVLAERSKIRLKKYRANDTITKIII